MPQPERLLKTVDQAARILRATPGRTGHFVRLPAGAEVLVGGDMHGNLENFRAVLHRADLASQPQRHLVLQEVVHGPFRYPDGSDKSHQLLDLIAALTCQYPGRVHFLLGNHELAQWQHHRIAKGDDDPDLLFRAGIEHAYGTWAERVSAAYDRLFAAADLALVTANRVFVSHSIPSARHLPGFTLAALEKEDLGPPDFVPGGAVHALVWGRDVGEANATAFLAKVGADWLLTGHIPCEEGY